MIAKDLQEHREGNMKGGARTMWKLRRGDLIVFAEKENKHILETIRRNDPEMKRGRITEVLQCAPSSIREGKKYTEYKIR